MPAPSSESQQIQARVYPRSEPCVFCGQPATVAMLNGDHDHCGPHAVCMVCLVDGLQKRHLELPDADWVIYLYPLMHAKVGQPCECKAHWLT